MKKERIRKIDELSEKMRPLKEKKVLISGQIGFSILKNSDPSELAELKQKLKIINEELVPLLDELRKNQIKYLVQYKGEYYNPKKDENYWEELTELLHFKTDIEIDTSSEDWEKHAYNPDFESLISEITSFLYNCRFTKFELLKIKRYNNYT